MTEKGQRLRIELQKIAEYKTIVALLYWDLQTKVPEGGEEALINAISYFSSQLFHITTSEEYGALLKDLSAPEEYAQLDEGLQLTVKRYLKDYEENRRIPKEFYEKMVRTASETERAWERAKRASDYSLYCPHLQKIIDMKKQQYEYTDPGKNVYDAMLEDFEPGIDRKTIDTLFDSLKKELIPLVKQINEKEQQDEKLFWGEFPIENQKKVQDLLLKYIGFSHERGTTGESEHPFTTTISYGDVRVTNHFKSHEAINAMFSAIHEGGHAIFEQNVAPEFKNTAAFEINMMGLHESQSRFYENILGRNICFWKPIYGQLCELLPEFGSHTMEEFEKEINRVQCSMIRTEADEVTYAFHIILRYELEREIFEHGATAEELPELWNKKMEELLGIVPETDAEGILQDMHWSDGSFGYFPSYLLGSIYDGMLLEALQKELGDVDQLLENGRILEITKWLSEKIHRYGSLYNSKEMLERVCKTEVSAKPLIRHFKQKYTKIYGLEQ